MSLTDEQIRAQLVERTPEQATLSRREAETTLRRKLPVSDYEAALYAKAGRAAPTD